MKSKTYRIVGTNCDDMSHQPFSLNRMARKALLAERRCKATRRVKRRSALWQWRVKAHQAIGWRSRGWQAPHRALAGGQTPLAHKIHFQNISHTMGLAAHPLAQEGDRPSAELLVGVDFPAEGGSFRGMFIRRAKLGLEERVRRVENLVLALVGKVKKMAEGQARFEQSFKTIQDGVTGAGRDLRAKLRDMVAAHDQRDDQAFEDHATQLDEIVNQVENLGHSGNTATKAGQSPSGTAGPSTGDLSQGRGQIAPQENTGIAGPQGDQPRASGQKGDDEHDVVVKGRDMPD